MRRSYPEPTVLLIFALPFLLAGTPPAFSQITAHPAAIAQHTASVQADRSLTRADKARLVRLRRAVRQLEKQLAGHNDRAAFHHFERLAPRSEAPAWERLVHQVPVNSEDYPALSFALAYYRVDYNRNLQRLLRPNRLWLHNTKQWAKEYPEAGPSDLLTDLAFVPFSLEMLYRKHHDLATLRVWLGLPVDGYVAEGSADSLGKLWKGHKSQMLRAAYGSQKRMNNLADALIYNFLPDEDSAKEWHALRTTLRRYGHSQDHAVALAARQLIPMTDPKTRTLYPTSQKRKTHRPHK